MTANFRPLSAADAIAAAEGWLAELRAYRGRLPADDAILPAGGAGWLIATLGRVLAVVVEPTFPFTRPKVYVRGQRKAMPHVEGDGRLCLRNPEVPTDPVRAIRTAVHAARELLRAIEDGSEDADFQEDFGAYWLHRAVPGRSARLLLPGPRRTGVIAWASTGAAYYGFASTMDLRRWWRHRFNAEPDKTRQGALVLLDVLPHPDEFPTTGVDLWNLIESRSADGPAVLGMLLKQLPKEFLVVLAGVAPSGRRHAVGLILARSQDSKGKLIKRRVMERGHLRGNAPPDVLCGHYTVVRLVTQALDAAGSRLPYAEHELLAKARVAVVGCGALGSGVARLLAKSGVGHLVFVDHEKLGWENIRRHQLGAAAVGLHKASTMAFAIAQENPDIGSVKAFDTTVEALLTENPAALDDVQLIVACTATWSANSKLDDLARSGGPPVLYGWMEAHALAAHAVLVVAGHSYRSGYDDAGSPRMTASTSDKPVPAECGALTSPFGAVELSHAETLTARLAIDFLRGKVADTTWRTWLTDAQALMDAEGRWTPEWIAARGEPGPLGGISTSPWWKDD